MNISSIIAEKKENNLKLKKALWILLKFKPLWLVKLSDKELTNELIEWLKQLPTWFVVYIENEDTMIISNNIVITWELDDSVVSWFDFVICDDDTDSLNIFIEKWITPIMIRNNHLASILKEFNPLKNEWNAFFYENMNKWDIFFTIVRYMENFKFPYDNKNLVKNVINW